ncbi:hypothetical protein ACH5A3_39230 [Streptomyces echinatus]|uniref:hypothetical protein n=1 Tax=Streptomyces echinatus TaxID=67293 RepID=UPI00379B2FB3
MEWWQSEAAASTKLEIQHKATGRLVAAHSGGADKHSIAAKWDGRDTVDGLLPHGPYTWTLTAQPADGPGTDSVRHASSDGRHGRWARPRRCLVAAERYR